MGYSYTTTTYLGYTVHVVSVKSDTTTDVQLTTTALPYTTTNNKKLTIDWRDAELEAAGWTRKAVINGGAFFL